MKTRPHDQLLQLFWCLIGLVGYCLPIWNLQSTGLQLSGYDLAEWVALHSSVQATVPNMFTAFLLRILLIGLLWQVLSMLLQMGLPVLIYVFATTACAIALLPPFEFFTQSSSDANYRQLFVSAIIMVLGAISIHQLANKVKPSFTQNIIATFIAISGSISIILTQDMFGYFGLLVTIGFGPIAILSSLIGTIINR